MRSPAAVCPRGASGETSGVNWLQSAVFALDRRIRDRLGVYEYTTHAQCLFRLQLAYVTIR
jgi:hypothetical protein